VGKLVFYLEMVVFIKKYHMGVMVVFRREGIQHEIVLSVVRG
jgi:hypothetical protein